MRGGYPVCVAHIERHTKKNGTLLRIETWWEARSPHGSRLHTVCGHRHRTSDAAKKCLPDVIEKYKALRWPKKKA
jgi:hypothetical protein